MNELMLKKAVTTVVGGAISSGDLPSAEGGTYFGASLAINSVGNICAVGSTPGTTYPFAYICTNIAGVWERVAIPGLSWETTLTQSVPYVGRSISLNSAGDVCVVGSAASYWVHGCIFMCTNTAGTWSVLRIPAASSWFGGSVSLNSVGNICAVGTSSYNSDNNPIFIYTNTSGTWYRTDISKPGNATSFGHSLSLNSIGDVCVVGAPTANKAFIYTKTTGWSGFELPSPGTSSFGTSVDINSIGDVCVVGAPTANAAYIFTKSGSVWSRVTLPSPGTTGFGTSVAINDAGNVCTIGASGGAKAYVYTNTGGTWSGAELLPSPGTTGFGRSTTINSAGDVCVVGANGTVRVYGLSSGTTVQ